MRRVRDGEVAAIEQEVASEGQRRVIRGIGGCVEYLVGPNRVRGEVVNQQKAK